MCRVKKNANSGLTCALENLENFAGDLRAILDLLMIPTCMSYTTNASRVG